MTRILIQIGSALLSGVVLLSSSHAVAQSGSAVTADATKTPSSTASGLPGSNTRRRSARRRARPAQQRPSQQAPAGAATVGPTTAQRQRDAQILAAQKAQSAAGARENDALTQKVVADQQKQQAEPRIQDAPGPNSQPLAGDPAVAPVQSSEPPRIQDAPGPAQTLPKPAPTPAPQP